MVIRTPFLPILFSIAICTVGVHAQSLPSVSGTQTAALSIPPAIRDAFTPAPKSEATPVYSPLLPLPPSESESGFSWKTGIVATVFWVGEPSSANNPTPNTASSWDAHWISSYGGYDDPDNRSAGYCPGFTPHQNPFYIALPYNDCVDCNTTKAEASKVVPWFKIAFLKHGQSVCRNHWLAIRHGQRTCYAQWSDCGPFLTTDANYVFGDSPPANSQNGGAGLDMSPAVRDFLGFSSGGKVDWRFVDESEVPEGPWKAHGANNPFASDWQKPADPAAPIEFTPRPGSGSAGAGSGHGVITNGVVRATATMPGLVLRSKR